MFEIKLNVTLEIEGPFLSQALTHAHFGVDAAPLLDSDGKTPIVPGSQVRGRVREFLERYQDDLPSNQDDPESSDRSLIKAGLGPKPLPEEIGEVQGDRHHRWYFSDFRRKPAELDAEPGKTFTRIAIDRDSGAVKSGALQVLQTAVPFGQTRSFEGTICYSAKSEKNAERIKQLLEHALNWITSLGASRGVGFGRLKGVFIKRETTELSQVKLSLGKSESSRKSGASCKAARRWLIARVLEPFCIGTRRTSGNNVTSVTHLPGNVLRGAVAFQLQRIFGKLLDFDLQQIDAQQSMLCQQFDQVLFQSAFPTTPASPLVRPTQTPLSFFKGIGRNEKKNHVRDASSLSGPFVIKAGDGSLHPPIFESDWKESSVGNWNSNWVEPLVTRRVRIAFDLSQRRARDQHLFSQELVHGLSQETGAPVVFVGAVAIENKDEEVREAIWEELQLLFEQTTFRVGKTKAAIQLELVAENAESKAEIAEPASKSCWSLCLQSPAQLLELGPLAEAWDRGIDATADSYRDYFESASKQSLRLVRRFSKETLGGAFLSHRANPKEYRAFLLTEARSVFVVEPIDATKEELARQTLFDWMRYGLPSALWMKEGASSWIKNPYRREDGFGEIIVDAADWETVRPNVGTNAADREVELL